MALPQYDRVESQTDSSGGSVLAFTPPTNQGYYYRLDSVVVSCDQDTPATYCKITTGDRILGFINGGNGQLGPALINAGDDVTVTMYNGVTSYPGNTGPPIFGHVVARTIKTRADLYGAIITVDEARATALAPIASGALNANLLSENLLSINYASGGQQYISGIIQAESWTSLYVDAVQNALNGVSVSFDINWYDASTNLIDTQPIFVIGNSNNDVGTTQHTEGSACIPVLGTQFSITAMSQGGNTVPNFILNVVGTQAEPYTGTNSTTKQFKQIEVAPRGRNTDAFNRLRVSNTYSLFDSTFEYDLNPMYWDTVNTGTGSVSLSAPVVTLATGATAGSTALLGTRNHFRYQPGKSQMIVCTAVIGGLPFGCTSLIGYGDASNGVFFGNTGNSLMFVRVRSNISGAAVDVDIPQAKWNIDMMDGNGPSGVSIDTTKAQLFVIDLQWLSIGTVRFGFYVDGVLWYCHAEHHGNIVTAPYMATANLPITVSITNGAQASNASFNFICCSVMSEGGQEQHGNPFSFVNGTGKTTTGLNAITPIMSVRLQSTFNGKTNRGLIIPTGFQVFSTQNVYAVAYINPVLTGATWAFTTGANSIAQLDIAATAIATAGDVAFECFVPASTTGGPNNGTASSGDLANMIQRKLSLNYAGTSSDILTIATVNMTANATTSNALITWLEQR